MIDLISSFDVALLYILVSIYYCVCRCVCAVPRWTDDKFVRLRAIIGHFYVTSTSFTFVLYRRESWFLILRVETRIWMFERNEWQGNWENYIMRNFVIYTLQIKKIILLGSNQGGRGVAHVREMRNVYRILVGKPKWKRLLGRPRRRWGIILE